jgi:hypothetical protein
LASALAARPALPTTRLAAPLMVRAGLRARLVLRVFFAALTGLRFFARALETGLFVRCFRFIRAINSSVLKNRVLFVSTLAPLKLRSPNRKFARLRASLQAA